MAEYKVQFEVFEGPLDLLLYLVKKEEVDIYQVNLTQLATQFIEYVDLMRELDLDVAGEFLVMAATLMYIKSRELLPRDRQAVPDHEDADEEDPRWELIRRLVEYKKFKDAAARLQELEIRQDLVYRRQPVPLEVERPPLRAEASMFDLLSGVNAVLKRVRERGRVRAVKEDFWTVSEKIEFIRQVMSERKRLTFFELFGATTTRGEVVATFLALLELVRLRVVRAIQREPFGEIELRAVELEPTALAQESAQSDSPPTLTTSATEGGPGALSTPALESESPSPPET